MARMDVETLVVGDGPYGFAAAGALAARGLEVLVVGEPFSLWRQHTLAEARLRSSVKTSAIASPAGEWRPRSLAKDVAKWPRRSGERVPVSAFRSYLERVEESRGFPLRRAQVVSLAATPGGFLAQLDDGDELLSRRVVLAAGLGPHRWLPRVLAELDSRWVAHSFDTRAYENASGRRLLVLGGGQSAGEAAAHLGSRNEVLWLMRKPPAYWSDPLPVPRLAYRVFEAMGAHFCSLSEPARRALRRWSCRPTVTPDLRATFRELGAVWPRGLAGCGFSAERDAIAIRGLGREFDLVIAGTGYRPRLEDLRFVAPALRDALQCDADGLPVLDRSFESSVRGLFIAGALAEGSHGPLQRFLAGAGPAARRIARSLAPQPRRAPSRDRRRSPARELDALS